MIYIDDSLPWNQNTLLGYFGESLFIMICGIWHIFAIGVMMLFYISMCIHHHAFYEMIRNSLDKWNQRDENENDVKFVCDQIRFHITIKE